MTTLRIMHSPLLITLKRCCSMGLFAGGEVNTTNNDGSGLVDMYCGGEWLLTELSIRRYELSAASLAGKLYFG